MKKRGKLKRKNKVGRESLKSKFILEQTLLSNERTMLSYVRTAFAALILGFALIQFAPDSLALTRVGAASIAAGILLIGIGLIHYSIEKKRIQNNNP